MQGELRTLVALSTRIASTAIETGTSGQSLERLQQLGVGLLGPGTQDEAMSEPLLLPEPKFLKKIARNGRLLMEAEQLSGTMGELNATLVKTVPKEHARKVDAAKGRTASRRLKHTQLYLFPVTDAGLLGTCLWLASSAGALRRSA
jgi:hypothetical protein